MNKRGIRLGYKNRNYLICLVYNNIILTARPDQNLQTKILI